MGNLTDYNNKRDFQQTEEPKGKVLTKKGRRLRFVVQRHHASRLHYDFRLELDGVLKSWAVPKGPSLNPKDKRLAVQVEDHPIDYGSFEGIIPKGNYGAGIVTIFDSGYYDFVDSKNEADFLEDWKKGSIKFTLHGHILKGEFALVRMKGSDGKSWLLIKHQDKYAVDHSFDSEDMVNAHIKKEGVDFKKKGAKKDTASQANPSPMLAKLSDQIPIGKEWIHEKKYDGFRIMAVKTKNEVQLFSRNGKHMNQLFPSLSSELGTLDRSVWLDGEVVIEDKEGKPYFQLLQGGEPLPAKLQLHYYVFDILQLEGQDLTGYSLHQRRELLDLLLKRMPALTVIQHVQVLKGDVDTLVKEASHQHWEGVMAKEEDSTYHMGKRSSAWVKFKFRQSQEAVICGYTTPQGNRSFFGALVLGSYDAGKLTYIGNCGTGFDEKGLKDIYTRLEKIQMQKKPFDKNTPIAKEKEVTWVTPSLVCEVYFSEWTMDKHLRHPIFKGLRTDKHPQDIQIEIPMKKQANEKVLSFGRRKVQLTNLNKVYWPETGYTKGQMLTYYERIQSYILPYLKDKPISMHRFPNGIAEEGFFQKDVDPEKIPSWIKTAQLYSESTDKQIDYLICNNQATLLYIANLGSIEINPWLSTYQKPDYPEFAVLDLDPNGADFQEVIKVAHKAHGIFEQAGVASFLKTSGSTGLHIYIYPKKKYDFDIVRSFIELVAQLVHEAHPDTTSLVRNPQKRKGMIYLDYLQNRKGQTVAAPYSLRPRPHATVGAPLFWEELTPKLRIEDYTILNMLNRIEQSGDPWTQIWNNPADIKAAISKF